MIDTDDHGSRPRTNDARLGVCPRLTLSVLVDLGLSTSNIAHYWNRKTGFVEDMISHYGIFSPDDCCAGGHRCADLEGICPIFDGLSGQPAARGATRQEHRHPASAEPVGFREKKLN
ncbi:hypothetical protein HDIA_2801 [Hartmannibacter diazotrophicus]|uniref:Uncharacterized protein n=1 Tax=Hartmannibacter diazotrophicus TaxID=1482074 RepID=A0A2C9D7P5_9HYPH|nr:hypothetical protein [Hartmannibacter diazotrophicus]SON56342.1 hypothetical protein HDIA_2801 [Hartmannibacter diazotrophicus]